MLHRLQSDPFDSGSCLALGQGKVPVQLAHTGDVNPAGQGAASKPASDWGSIPLTGAT